MWYQVLFLILLIDLMAFPPHVALAILIDKLHTGEWDGVAFYISVKREAIQTKLDDYHNSVSNECNDGPRLFMPEVPVLPDIHNNDRHPIFVDFEFVRSHDFKEYLENNPDPSVSTSGQEVAVTIPLLAGSPNGPPLYALALNKFYEKSRGDIPKMDFLYPYMPVDEIFLHDYGAFVRNGSDEMRISFNRSNISCRPLTSVVNEEFDEFVSSDFQFGLPAPEYSFCDRHSFESQFCSNAERIKCGVKRYAPNVCQKWVSDYLETCATTVEIENITPKFREFTLLGDGAIDILAAERYFINGSMALKYPCQEYK